MVIVLGADSHRPFDLSGPARSHVLTLCSSWPPLVHSEHHRSLQCLILHMLWNVRPRDPLSITRICFRELGRVPWGLYNRMCSRHSLSAQLPTGPCVAACSGPRAHPVAACSGPRAQAGKVQTKSAGFTVFKHKVSPEPGSNQLTEWLGLPSANSVWPLHRVPSKPSACPPQASMTSTAPVKHSRTDRAILLAMWGLA